MSEQVQESKPEVKQEAPKQEAAPQPQVDVEAITKKATDEARKAADEKLKKVAKALSGEEEEARPDPLLVALAKDTKGFLGEFAVQVKEQAKREMKEESAAQSKQAEKAQEIARPFLDKYPEMKDHMDDADAYMKQALHSGEPLEKAIESAFNKTVKKFNLKSLSDEERQRQAAYAGIPPVGSPGMPSQEKQTSSAMDYINSLRKQSKAIRGQLPKS